MAFTVLQEENGTILFCPQVFHDERGFFMEAYKKSDFQKIGIDVDFVQDNHSFSKKGVIRALHYQLPPFAQAKLVQVISGEIIDIAVTEVLNVLKDYEFTIDFYKQRVAESNGRGVEDEEDEE